MTLPSHSASPKGPREPGAVAEPFVHESGSDAARATAAPGFDPDYWATCREGVRLIALRTFGDPAIAEDIAQEAIARALDVSARRPGEIADLGAFVYGIARHAIADAIRSRSRAISVASEHAHYDPRPDALSDLISDEERAHLKRAVQELSHGDSRLLRLAYVEGLTSVEIGVRLRQSPATVRKRKERAIERLRSAFSMNASHSAGQRDY